MDGRSIAALIDHTLLRADATLRDIERLCSEVLEYGFAAACVNSAWVPVAAGVLKGRSVVCSVVGFPLGASCAVAAEAAAAVEAGAGELDMVMPVGFLKSGMYRETTRVMEEVVEASAGRPVKVIIETCFLTDDEKVMACRLAMDSGASWVKTSTGFGSGGATTRDVSLMKKVVGGRLGVKASGGIRTLEDAVAMLEAGADRLGCSESVAIVTSVKRGQVTG